MGIFDLFKRKNNGSIDEQMKQEAKQMEVKAIQEQELNVNISGPFSMKVEDVFTITGRGTIVTGRVTSGKIGLNETITIEETGKTTTVKGIEMFRKTADFAQAGDNVGILLDNIARDEIQQGYTIKK